MELASYRNPLEKIPVYGQRAGRAVEFGDYSQGLMSAGFGQFVQNGCLLVQRLFAGYHRMAEKDVGG
jgi:hypothetical protein